MTEKIEPILRTAEEMFYKRVKEQLENALQAARLDCETIPLQLEVINSKLDTFK